MPQLPTLTVTDAQATRLIAVFGDVAGYKAWLLRTLKAAVMAAEEEAERQAAKTRVEAKRAELEADMTGIT